MKAMMLSGYKPFELGVFQNKSPEVEMIQMAIEKRLRIFIEDGLQIVCISGQQGVELWGAEVVLKLKQEYPQLKLAILTPFLNQDASWKEASRDYYQSIISRADMVKSTSDQGYDGVWQFRKRNDVAMQNCDGLLLVYDEEREGSPKFLKQNAEYYGKKNDFALHTIDFWELQEVAEEEAEKRRDAWGFE